MESNLFKDIWNLSFKDKRELHSDSLTELTSQLIQLYESQGRLSDNPLAPALTRTLSLPNKTITKMINGKVCLVTGGLGCVGSKLVEHLMRYAPSKIIILDKTSIEDSPYKHPASEKIISIQEDVTNEAQITALFSKHLPEFVFHTAAQRDPGLAEKAIFDTVRTNIIGTLNILNACEKTKSVHQCVFSSTGKASRYFTTEIYAATKKVCEMLLDVFARKGNKKYSMVRFTHIVNNSLMDHQLKKLAQTADYITIHAPGKFVTAQNVEEAACLMQNALIYSELGKCKFLLVKNLEWPVESLELALYYIKTYKRRIPIVFSGNPRGYSEKFFRGQLDWKNPTDLNLLINVYENRNRTVNPEDDIIISSIVPFSSTLLDNLIQDIVMTEGEENTKKVLVEGLKAIFNDSLNYVEVSQTQDILKWGLDPKYLDLEGLSEADFQEMTPSMFASIANIPS